MFRVTLLSGKAYALTIPDIESDIDNTESLVNDGNIVILTDDLRNLTRCGIDPDDIINADDEE